MKIFKYIIITLLLTGFISSCAIKSGSINGVATAYNKAEHRVIYVKEVEPSIAGMILPTEIICTEPSPDIAKATQTALSLVAKLKGEEALQISHSSAEAITALVERTTTIQLLRDQLFRACESYANGAISATSYSLLMSRNNKAMITLMLGETAAGAFGRSGAVLGGKSNSEGTLSSEGFGEGLKEALAELEPIDKAIIDAKAEQKENETNMATLKEDEKNKTTEIAELKTKMEAKEKEIAGLEKKKNNTLMLVQSKYNLMTKTAAEITTAEGFGALSKPPSEFAVEALANMQEIYMRDSLADEVISACVVEMGMNPSSLMPSVDKATLNDAINAFNISGTRTEKNLVLGALRKTMLSKYCEDNLHDMVTHAEKNRQRNVGRYYDLQNAKIKDNMMSICNRFTTEDQRAKCLNEAGINIPGSTEKYVNLKYMEELYSVNELEKTLETLKTKIGNERKLLFTKSEKTPTETDIKDNEIKSKKLMGKDKTNLRTAIVDLINSTQTAKIQNKIDKGKQGTISEPITPNLDKVKKATSAFIEKTARIYQKNGGNIPTKGKKRLTFEYRILQFNLDHFVEKLTEIKKSLMTLYTSLNDINMKIDKIKKP